MKKFIILGVILTMFTSCVKSTYEVKYVDTKCPTDTLVATAVVNERVTYRGEDVFLEMNARNVGLSSNPLLVYEFKIRDFVGSTKIHTSYEPIKVVSLKYVGPKEKESMWGPKEK